MDTRRVFIIWSHPLFRDTIHLLLRHPALEIVGIGSDLDTVLQELDRTQPEIIIVEQNGEGGDPGIDMLKVLKAGPWEARVIRLSLQDNELWIYHRQRQNVNTPEDFLRIIQDE